MTVLPDSGLMACGSFNDGIHAYFSYNNGSSWAFEDILFSRDYREGMGQYDVGSPSSVVLNDEKILVVYYAAQNTASDWHSLEHYLKRQ